MTTENNAAQPVLTDDEILAVTLYGQSEARIIRNGRAIEQAVLSKLRAPVANVPLTHRCANCGAAFQGAGCPSCRLAAPVASAPVEPEAAETDFMVRVLESLDTWRAEEWNELIERRPAIFALLRPLVLASAPVARSPVCAPTWEEVKEANSVLASYSWNSNGEGGGVTATERKLAAALLRVAGVDWNPNGDPVYALRTPGATIQTLVDEKVDPKYWAESLQLRTPASAPVAGEAVAALIRERRYLGKGVNGKHFYSEFSEWFPATVSHAKAVTSPGRDPHQTWDVRWLVDAAPQASSEAAAAVRTLTAKGYTWRGGEQWKPPLGDNIATLKRLNASDALEVARAALMEIADLADVEADQRGVIVNQALTKIDKLTAAPQASEAVGVEAAFARVDRLVAVRDAALEEAAMAVEARLGVGDPGIDTQELDRETQECADAIRALKSPSATLPTPQADNDGGNAGAETSRINPESRATSSDSVVLPRLPEFLERELTGLEECEVRNYALAAVLADRQQRAPVSVDLDAAAQALAECMYYPWTNMPEEGRTHMRENAQTVVSAALAAQPGAKKQGGSDA